MSDELSITSDQTAALVVPIRNTLVDVLRDPIINEDFGGKDGRLTRAQSGLAAAVVVKMQERLMQQMERAHQRELNLIAGFWKLYRTPVFRRTWQHAEPKKADEPPPKPSRFAELFTWGNLVGGAAIVICALAFYYTKLTASYEEHWKSAESDSSALRVQLESEQKANEALQFELGKTQSRADVAEKTLTSLTSNAAEQQQQLLTTINDLSLQRGELAKQVAASSGEKKFQSLYDGAQRELTKLRKENADLTTRAIRAEEQLKAKK